MTGPEPSADTFAYEQLLAMRELFPGWQIRIQGGMWIAEHLTRDTAICLRQHSAEALRAHIGHHSASMRQLANQAAQVNGSGAVDL